LTSVLYSYMLCRHSYTQNLVWEAEAFVCRPEKARLERLATREGRAVWETDAIKHQLFIAPSFQICLMLSKSCIRRDVGGEGRGCMAWYGQVVYVLYHMW